MESRLKASFVNLIQTLKENVEINQTDSNLWKDYVREIPYCELIRVSGEEILRGVQFAGRIHIWLKFPDLSEYFFDDEEEDEEDSYDPLKDTQDSLTAQFFFKEHNKATLIYPTAEGLPKFKGTWSEVFLEIIDFVRRKFCDDPKPPKKIAGLVQLLTPGQT
jgi:hypothetical protein